MAGQTSTGDNTQFGITSIDGDAPDPDTTYGKGRKPMVDGKGRLAVRIADAAGFVDGGFPTRHQTSPAALVDTDTLAAFPMQIDHLFGHKSAAGAFYFQLYDQPGGSPVGVPVVVLPLVGAADQAFSFDLPWRFSGGCVYAISTSRLAYVSAGPILYLAAQWRGP